MIGRTELFGSKQLELKAGEKLNGDSLIRNGFAEKNLINLNNNSKNWTLKSDLFFVNCSQTREQFPLKIQEHRLLNNILYTWSFHDQFWKIFD